MSKKQFTYSAFGLTVSSEIALPDWNLLPSPGPTLFDLYIRCGKPPAYLQNTEKSFRLWQVSESEALFCDEVTGSMLVRNGTEIVVAPNSAADLSEFLLYMTGSAMGAIMYQRGDCPLHGAAVSRDGQSYVFLGDSGYGKSTLSAAFVQKGYGLLTDDVCRIIKNEKSLAVQSGYPRIKLSSESLQGLDISDKNLAHIDSRRGKRSFPAMSGNNDNCLRAIYLMEEGETISTERLSGVQSIGALLGNLYHRKFLTQGSTSSRALKFCEYLANTVPIYQLKRPRGFQYIPCLISELESQWKSI